MGNALELQPVKEQSHHEAATPAHDRDAQGLLLIGLFKLSKALGCILLGVMCLHLIHRDLGDVAMQIIRWLDIDSGDRLATFLLDKADLINGHQLRITGVMSFVGAALYTVEGTGLMLRKVWAEYFTVVLTTLGIPWEIYEMGKHFTLWKLGLFVINILVLAYLIWILRRKREQRIEARLNS
jgi:uncharacterized membrane protein (DUF2068 family)